MYIYLMYARIFLLLQHHMAPDGLTDILVWVFNRFYSKIPRCETDGNYSPGFARSQKARRVRYVSKKYNGPVSEPHAAGLRGTPCRVR